MTHADHSPRATAFLHRLYSGHARARTADTVVFETVFTLERTYKQPQPAIQAILLLLPTLTLPNKCRMRRAFALSLAHAKLSFADCYHIALMEGLRLTTLVSFDQDFDQLPTVTRQTPDISGSFSR